MILLVTFLSSTKYNVYALQALAGLGSLGGAKGPIGTVSSIVFNTIMILSCILPFKAIFRNFLTHRDSKGDGRSTA